MESTEWSDRRPDGPYTGANPAYVDWLVDGSMLESARRVGTRFTGTGTVWQYPFATPNPRAAVAKAPVWFTAYPSSMITREGESFLAALGDDELWATLASIGIRAVHTGPVKRAGGITGVELTPSIDGHFDRISTDIDPAFGTVDEFRSMSQAAQAHGGTVIDDIVPAPTEHAPFGQAGLAGEDGADPVRQHCVIPHGQRVCRSATSRPGPTVRIGCDRP